VGHLWKIEKILKEMTNFTTQQNYIGTDDSITAIVGRRDVGVGEKIDLDLSDLGQIHFNNAKIKVKKVDYKPRAFGYYGSVRHSIKVDVERATKKFQFK